MTTSPVAASKPRLTAFPFPVAGTCRISRISRVPRSLSMAASIAWPVPSVESPSTKMISVRGPMRGMRAKVSAMFPTSFRQGTTTLQVSGRGSRATGSGRMTRKWTRSSRRIPGRCARSRFASPPSRGIPAGQSSQYPPLQGFEPRHDRQVDEVVGRQPVLHGLRHLEAQSLRGAQDRLPQVAIVGHHHPRGRVADRAEIPERQPDIAQMPDHVGQDHVIKLLPDLQSLHITDRELYGWILPPSHLDHARTEVDPATPPRSHGVQQIPGAATDFQNRGPWRDEGSAQPLDLR